VSKSRPSHRVPRRRGLAPSESRRTCRSVRDTRHCGPVSPNRAWKLHRPISSQDRGFADTPIPPSNAITIRVADGPVRPSRQIARSLFDTGLPPGWRVYVYEEGKVVPLGRSSETGTALALRRAGRSLADAHVVLIWVTASFSPLESPKQDGRVKVQPNGSVAARGRGVFVVQNCDCGRTERDTNSDHVGPAH
jgi:hypothetical protein